MTVEITSRRIQSKQTLIAASGLWVCMALVTVGMEIWVEYEPFLFYPFLALFTIGSLLLKKKSLLVFAIYFAFYWLDSLPESLERFRTIPTVTSIVPLIQTLIALAILPGRKIILRFFQVGNLNSLKLWGMSSAVSAVSAVALLIWAKWAEHLGIVIDMVKSFSGFQHSFLGVIVVLFAFVNAAVEEITYRGVFYELMLKTFFKPLWPVVLTSLMFASVHFQIGVPHGWPGFVMAFFYGLALGFLRIKSGGILVPFVTHVVTDLCIFGYVYTLVH